MENLIQKFQLVTRELRVPPSECLVIEDSPSGVKAALAAGTWCIAVTTPFTRKEIRTKKLLDEQWIVDKANETMPVVKKLIEKRKED